jgi:hypothetical protein
MGVVFYKISYGFEAFHLGGPGAFEDIILLIILFNIIYVSYITVSIL